MHDLLYWLCRITLVLTWLLVAALAGRRHAEGRAVWLGCALAALLFASMRAVTWNYLLLEAGRALLRSGGVYDERFWFKLLLAVLLAAGLLLLVVALRRVSAPRAALLCAVGILLHGALLGIETFSLDDALPRWLLAQPGRYLYEGLAAAIALLAARSRPRP